MFEGEKVVAAGPDIGELGWCLSGFSGAVRYIKSDSQYRSHKFVVFSYPGRYPIFHDFANLIVPLPNWFTNLGLPQASYDCVGITPEIYGDLIKYFRRFYYKAEDVLELRPPRGHTWDIVHGFAQAWNKLSPTELGRNISNHLLMTNGLMDKDIMVVMPRYRVGISQKDASGRNNTVFSDNRNWPPAYWQDLIVNLARDFVVVVSGTKNGTPPLPMNIPNVINLSSFDPVKLMDVTLAFMDKAVICVSSQSGGTHLGLQAMCPSWMMGFEKHRHSVLQNPLKTPCTFMEIPLPFVVPPQEVYGSVIEFYKVVREQLHEKRMARFNQSGSKSEPKPTLQNYSEQCTICEGELQGPVVRDLLQCSQCGAYKKAFSPSKEVIINAHTGFMLSYTSHPDKEEERTKEANFQLDMIERFCKVGKLFDVGCAAGLFMKVARDRGWVVDGNEISKAAIEYGKEVWDIDIKHGMLEDLEVDKDFDAFVLWHTLEHCMNPITTMQFCNAHLKPGGVVQIGVPLKLNKKDVDARYEDIHLWEFSRASLNVIMEKCGFEIVHTEDRAPNNDFQINIIGRKK